ncbi:serine/threonine protein kinase, CMGC, dual-specificity [Cryptotrichosporon argae]
MERVEESPRRERPRHKSLTGDTPSKNSSHATPPAPLPSASTYARLDQIMDGFGSLSFDSTVGDSASQSFAHRLSRDARKTPPSGKDRERDASLSSKRRQPVSPSAPHHDILKHIAPKDFSHLPPSPSSASINQFLRASGSTKDIAATLRSPGQATHTPSGLGRSDSQRKRGDLDTQTAEALRKLDGLSSTPKRASVKSKASSHPDTPPTSAKSDPPARPPLATRTSTSSFGLGEKDSPLGNWIDITRELSGSAADPRQDTLVPDRANDYKRTSSASSFVGTPTSRDSHPTASTTPSSTSGQKGIRRQSGQSDVSSIVEGDDTVEGAVPPVPPLPRGYMSMRQGLSNAAQPVPTSYVPLRDAPIEESPVALQSPQISVSSEDGMFRPRTMSKKWSFSSALNLKLHKDSTSPASSPALQPGEFDGAPSTTPSSPHTPWTQVERADVPSSPGLPQQISLEPDQRFDNSVTPVAQGLSPGSANAAFASDSAKHPSKRLTPSSIPFFRRSSSTSIQPKTSPTVPETPKVPQAQRTPSGSTVKKSVFGMLRGSVGKKGHGQIEKASPPEPKVDDASTGWGRRRGRTISIADAPAHLPDRALMPKTSVESSLSQRGSTASNGSESTVAGPRSTLPAIVGSPALRNAPSTSSLRNRADIRVPSSTPTKIPRAALRPNPTTPGGHSSMPPPAVPLPASQSTGVYSATGTPMSRVQAGYGTMPAPRAMASNTNLNDLSRPAINEFGVVTGTATPRQTTSSAHRNHLLQPMSARPQERKVSGPISSLQPAAVKNAARDNALPASRRALPQPPSSTLTALTASAAAKRTSREAVRPGLSRRGSSSTNQDDSASDVPSMKQSKSLHAKLNAPSTKLSSSSSMGATVARRSSLLPSESPAVSPFEDEESVADNEMAAYVKRRQARSAASGGKKDDLSDLIGFPEDIAPAQAVSQRSFISKHLASMSDYERKEVLDFDHIYFSARNIQRPTQSGGVYNSGYDDERGDYLVVPGDHLCYRYEVVGVLGKGSFGQVVQCRDHKTGGSVAVKIIRNKKRFHAQALVEVKILAQLVEWDPEDKHYMVKMTDHFYFRGHLCIVTELLSINLYELIKHNQFNGFSTALIRRFTTQMLAGLQLMRSHRIVHCDLKPENILLKHPAKSGIKVIDFGSSCHESEKVYTYIQSRFYRSPEVILGMNYAMAIDMWSLGCILAELYTGFPIFPGENEHEQLACIIEVLGVPDKYLVDRASRRKLFFDATGAPRPFVNAKGKRRRPGSKTLASVLKCNDELFLDFIAKCLTWDPDKRLKPQPAMRHPWIVAGRRRAPPPRPEERRSLLAGPSSSSLLKPSRTSKDNGHKGGLVISPPTPLVARQTGVPSSTSRIGPSTSTARLTHQSRNSAYIPTSQKASLA